MAGVGEAWLFPGGSVFPTGGTGGSGETSSHGAVPAWGKDNVVNVQLLLLPS